MKEEIMACPFCGGDAYLDKASNDLNDIESKNYIIRCRDCRVNTAWYEDKAKCIHNWNTRIVSELERLARIGEKAESARKQVNNAIYFDGNNDYVPFLREICKILGMDDEKIGKEYLED